MNHPIPNNLINETSPYLQQHAYNPVQWYPWGNEAIEKAYKEDKPVLISIGYYACHWCHVMEKECFENPVIADLMNTHFVNIKVDREERPDIDQIYMEAVQLMNVRGGWPLNVFLTPVMKPFYGGTYFPPTHWSHLLTQITKAFKDNRKELENSADLFTESLQTSELDKYQLEYGVSADNANMLHDGLSQLKKDFDKKHGGISGPPKFPMPSLYLFFLNYHYFFKDEDVLTQSKLTLQSMAMGGIFDHLAGGFSRYSTDEKWLVPHFEKMLYDNGQLLELYAQAFKLTKTALFKHTAYATVKWMTTTLQHEAGVFFSAMDADSEGIEGKFYVWKYEELKGVAGNDFLLLQDFYSVSKEGNWEHGNNILHRSLTNQAFMNKHRLDNETFTSKVEIWMQTLLSERERRVKPSIDKKIITSWNLLAASGLLSAYEAFQEDVFLEQALKIVLFFRKQHSSNTKLHHTYSDYSGKTPGLLEDYALLMHLYLIVYQHTFDEQWIKEAEVLYQEIHENFFDTSEGLYFYTSVSEERLIARKKEIFDNVIPSSNSIMARNILLLGNLKSQDELISRSGHMIFTMQQMFSSQLRYVSNWASIFSIFFKGLIEVAIVGEDALLLRKEFNTHFLPNVLFTGVVSQSTLPLLQGKPLRNGETLIYVCHNKTCQAPVPTVAEALSLISLLN